MSSDVERTAIVAEGIERGAKAPPRLARLTVADIFRTLPAIDWLVEGIDFCPGVVNVIAGSGFSGKTAAAQQMAIDVAGGRKLWGTFSARSARVIHIDYEQGARLTLERYQRLAAAADLTPADLGDRLSVIVRPPVYLDSPRAEYILARECEDHGLLIIDSLRAAAPTVDENDSGVRAPLDMLSRISESTGVVPLVLHHSRKPSKDATGGAKANMRGSGAIFDACGSVLMFEGQKNSPTRVVHEKARTSGRPLDDFLLRIEDVELDGRARAGLRVFAEGLAPEEDAPTATLRALMTRIVDSLRADGPAGSKSALAARVRGNRSLVLAAIDQLVSEGVVVVQDRIHRLSESLGPQDGSSVPRSS